MLDSDNPQRLKCLDWSNIQHPRSEEGAEGQVEGSPRNWAGIIPARGRVSL